MSHRSLSADIKDRYVDLALADLFSHIAFPVNLLLGADLFPSMGVRLPTTFNSIFGWILIMGLVKPSRYKPVQSCPVSLTVSIETLTDRF